MPLDAGHRLGPYEIREPLGAGGMGEVYRARDTRLHRDVAIKVLSPQLAADPEALGRFEREARAIAALSHPNILAIYDVGKDGGVSFVVTELLEGETLRTRLQKGALPARDALACATRVARALATAHDKNLVHRDLKPENVFLTHDGQVKLLDFGLAKPTVASALGAGGDDSPTVTSHTRAGLVLGTVGYMSPEQARGREADPRSDLFAFGAVLYEMIAGKRAFFGPTPADTISAILTTDPPRLSSTSSTATALDAIAHRCLAKNAAERYQSARELLAALESAAEVESGASPLAHATAVDGTTSIAVLPFADMSPSKDQDYFCEGMAEEILSALGQIEGLRVAARTSTFQFKGKTEDIRVIGEALHVSKVLEGSVRTAGTRLRVTAQLINVADGYRLWSERYDREMEDVFAIQDEIAQSVVNALKLTLVEPELPEGGQKHTKDVEAYHLYMKGRHHRYKQEFRDALKLYEQAVERDPGYAVARAGIAAVCVLLANYGLMRPRIAFARCEEELEHAMALAGETADVKCVEAWYRSAYEWDPDTALAAGRRAIELDPDHIVAHAWHGLILSCIGRNDEAVAVTRRTIELDPLSPYGFGMMALALLMAGRNEECITVAREGLALAPDHSLSLWPLSYACIALGRTVEAIEHMNRLVANSNRACFFLSVLGYAKARAGDEAGARAILEEFLERSKREYVGPIFSVRILANLGDIDAAVAKYEQSAAQRDPFAMFVGVPGLELLENDPRFRALKKKMGVSA